MKSSFGKFFLLIVTGILLSGMIVSSFSYGQQPIVGSLKEKANPFSKTKTKQGAGGQLTEFIDPKERDRLRVSGDIPQMDSFSNLKFKRPEDKDPEEMTEDDFFKTITPAETVILTPTPKKPVEFFRAGVLIASAGRPQFARLCFRKIKEMLAKDEKLTITPQEYAQVIDEVGFAKILYLITNTAVGPEGTQAAQKAMDAARTVYEDPKNLNEAVKRFSKASVPEKTAALIALRKGGDQSVTLLIDQLKTAADTDVEPVQRLLALLGENSFDALIVTLLNTKDEKLADRILGTVHHKISAQIPDVCLILYYDTAFSASFRNGLVKRELVRYFGSIPTLEEVTARLDKKTWQWYRRETALPKLINDRVSIWTWNNETQKAVLKDLTVDEYYLDEAAIWARACWRIAQNLKDNSLRSKILSLAIAVVSEKLLYQAGLDKPLNTTPLTAEFPKAEIGDYERALTVAMTENHFKGGIMPVILMGKSEKPELCFGKKNSPSPLIQAAASPDRRLRFTALSAVSRLNPDKPFPGSSRIVPSLILFMTSRGERKVIVAAPKLEDAMRNGDFFVKEGYSILPVTTGGNLIRQAQLDADVELVAATTLIGSPDMLTVTQILGQDYRTADIPVLLCANTTSFPRPVHAQSEQKWAKNPQELPLEADKGIIVDSYNPGDKNITREVWAIRLSEQNIDPKDVSFEFIDKKSANQMVSTPQLKKTIKAPILFELETKIDNSVATKMSGEFSNVLALPMPYDQTSAKWALTELFAKTDKEPVPAPIRKAQGKAAAAILLRLYTAHPEIYLIDDILFLVQRMISSEELFDEGIQLALLVREAKIQQILANKIGDIRLALGKRQQLLQAFTDHLDRYGNLLRGPEIRALYDRYNASEKEDQQTQKLLSDMLDVYEKSQRQQGTGPQLNTTGK